MKKREVFILYFSMIPFILSFMIEGLLFRVEPIWLDPLFSSMEIFAVIILCIGIWIILRTRRTLPITTPAPAIQAQKPSIRDISVEEVFFAHMYLNYIKNWLASIYFPTPCETMTAHELSSTLEHHPLLPIIEQLEISIYSGVPLSHDEKNTIKNIGDAQILTFSHSSHG